MARWDLLDDQRQSWLRRWLQIALLFALVLLLHAGGALLLLERPFDDLRFRMVSRPPSADLVLVAIDPPSLRELNSWPWPRDYHATLIDSLVAAGARTVALDIDFSSPSDPVADARLEESLQAAAGRVVLPVFKEVHRGADGTEVILNEPLPRFRQHVRVGSVSVQPSRDGLVRELNTREVWADAAPPSFPALLAGLGDAPFDRFTLDFGIELGDVLELSYADVLAGRFDPEVVRDKVVLVGATALGLQDFLPVPLYGVMSGVRVQALGYETLVGGRALHRLGMLPIGVILALVALLVCARFAAWPWRRGLAVLIGLSATATAASLAVQAIVPVIVDVTPVMLMSGLSYVAGLIIRVDAQAVRLVWQTIRLERTSALTRGIVEQSFDGIVTVGASGSIETANAAAESMFGYAAGGLAGRRLGELLCDPHSDSGDREAFLHSLHGYREVSARRRNGSTFPAEIAVSDMEFEDDRMRIVIVRDVTEREAQRQRLEHQALHDDLTGLPNRRLLHERMAYSLEIARREGRQLALLLLDLDRFKEVNDTLGHPVGDALLHEVARRLGAVVRKTDTVARIGGDEFAILLHAVADQAKAGDIAQLVCRALERPFSFDGLSMDLHASVGIAIYPDHADEPARLMQRADVAMYLAKRLNLTFAFYDQDKDLNSVRNLTLTGELRRAIGSSQMCLHYQPKLDLRTGKMRGVEALARWRHPNLGDISAEEFIAHAERTGLIQPITEWVLDTAMAQLAEWQRAGRDIAVAVNLSTRSLHDTSFPRLVASRIEAHRVDPSRLTFEITESALMLEPECAFEVIDRLHEIGVRLSVDDFGTGYSSLRYLQRMRLDEMKIDKSFVLGMVDNEGDALIVRSTTDLAHNLGLTVVAEGVETDAHVAMLERLRCDLAQGYFFARPMPADALAAWLAQFQPAAARAKPAEQLAGAARDQAVAMA